MKKVRSGEGWAGHVRLVGLAFIFSPFYLVVVPVVFSKPFYGVFDAMFDLWFTVGLHFGSLLAPLGGHLEHQGLPWAALCTPFGLL